MTALIIIALQYLVSAKAGFVNQVHGQANVQLHEQVVAAMPIETGERSNVEVLLNPGSYLRLGEESKVVLDSVDLTNVAIRVLEGSAMIEVAEADKHNPIRVSIGNLQTMIVSPGLYRFSGDTAVVIDGKLRTADSSKTIKKGQQLTASGDSYVQSPTTIAFADGLDRWSAQRSAEVARANVLAYRGYSTSGSYSSTGFNPYSLSSSSWFYSPLLGGFTFIPLTGYRSYYGYRFVPLTSFAPAPTRVVRSASNAPASAQKTRSAPATTAGTTSHPGLPNSRGARTRGRR